VPAARQKRAMGRDVDVAGRAQRSACCREASTAEKWPLQGGMFLAKRYVALDAKDEALDEVLEGCFEHILFKIKRIILDT